MVLKLKGQGTHLHGRFSITAAFLSVTALVYVLVLGTQFKMMSIIGNHAEISPGGHHVTTVVKSIHEGESVGKQLEHRLQRKTVDAKPNPNVIAQGQSDPDLSRQYKALASSIAAKWNLTTSNAVDLLEQQFLRENDYNPQNDFFHFHHLYKSGGTSFSNLMDKTIGLPNIDGKKFEGILPGSYESGNFDHDEALADINARIAGGTDRGDLPYKASYAHTGLRPVYGPRRTKTGIFLLKQLPHKRLRVITMLRDLTDFRASNHAMIMCGLNYEVSRFNNERAAKGLERICSPRDGLNISALVDRKLSDLMEKCRVADETEARGEKPKLNSSLRQQCKREKRGIRTLDHCRSSDNLLSSPQYDKHYRSMFKALMGRFHRGQKFTNGTAYGRMGYGFERAEVSNGYSVEKVEEYTLQDLGGLDLTISGDGDGVGPPEPDFIFFGLTERMKESTSLFYYYFKAKPLPKTPNHRVQSCRPNSWWTSENKEEVIRREPADYAVWRAANAIMDVRMEKMKMEIQTLLNAGETKESLYYVDWDQLKEVGINLERQK